VSTLEICSHFQPPLLDEHICGPLTQSGFITLQLERSGYLPLTLSVQLFHSLHCSCKPDPFFDHEHYCPHGDNEDFTRLLENFTPHHHCIVALDVRYLRCFGNENFGDIFQHRFFRDPLPNLERLSWVSRSLNVTNERGATAITRTNIFSDSLPRLRELVLVNTWGLISTAGLNLKTLKVQYLGPVPHPDTVMPVPGLQDFLSHHPLLTSVSFGDIRPQVDKNGGGPVEMGHLTNFALTSRQMDLDLNPTLRCFRFGTLEHTETLIIRRELMQYGAGSIELMLKLTWVGKNGHCISRSIAGGEFGPLDVWEAFCKAGVCDGVTTVGLKGPRVRSSTSSDLVSLFEGGLPYLSHGLGENNH